MDLLYPRHEPDVDVGALYANQHRVRSDRPYVLANMVASTDGATALDGRSGGLGDEADREVFRILRTLAPVILVGAATVRAERYRPSTVSGQRIAVVTRSLNLDLTTELFADGRGVVVTTEDAGPVPASVPVIRAGTGSVDLAAALDQLDAPTVLTEGGPGLIHELISADLLDELCLTLAPWLVGGPSKRIGQGPNPANPVGLDLAHVACHSASLFLRYVRSAAST